VVAAGVRQQTGAAGERLAARWYDRHGFEIVERNWRCAAGEIDLVCRRGTLLVVCEVKTRRSDRYGTAAEAVTPAKQRRLRRLAAAYLAGRTRPFAVREIRFDVATVTRSGVEVLEAAF
jgi:putative endonuclease